MDYILDHITIGDWLQLSECILERQRRNSILSLAITQNPYTENPQALFTELRGVGKYDYDEQIDRERIKRLKKELGQSKMIKVKE